MNEAGPVSVAWKPKLFVAPNKGMLHSRVFLFEQKQAPVHGGYFWFVIRLWLSDTNMSEIKIKVGESFGGKMEINPENSPGYLQRPPCCECCFLTGFNCTGVL